MPADDDVLLMFSSELPTDEPDPRQAQFLGVMNTMKQEGFQPISMRGFPASRVDLGWIQAEIEDYVTTMPDVQADDVVELVGKELPRVVQRLKGWSVNTDAWPASLSLTFETKDDYGWYEYRVSMSLDLGDSDDD